MYLVWMGGVVLLDRSLALSFDAQHCFVDAYLHGCLGQNQFGSLMQRAW